MNSDLEILKLISPVHGSPYWYFLNSSHQVICCVCFSPQQHGDGGQFDEEMFGYRHQNCAIYEL